MCRSCRNTADNEKSKRWAQAHPDEASARHLRYEARNNESRRTRYQKDPIYKAQADAAVRRFREANLERLNADHRERHRAARQTVLDMYGRACACCGENRWQFLALDHVNGDGGAHRKVESVTALYRRLAKSGEIDPRFRLLCHNCNTARGHYGLCPHESERERVDAI